MKKIIIMSILATACTASQVRQPAIPQNEEVENQVEQALSNLSLDEKIGQMCELTIDVITDVQSPDFRLNEEALQKVFGKYHVGSILNVPKGVAQKPEVWSTLIRRLNQLSMEACAGVPQIYGGYVPRYRQGRNTQRPERQITTLPTYRAAIFSIMS